MRQVFLFIFWVGQQKVDFIVLYQVVNDANSTVLSSPLCRPANLPQTATTTYNVSRFWLEGEGDLKTSVIGVHQKRIDLLGEDRSFDEEHMTCYTPVA